MNALNLVIVSIYKLIGFLVLTAILFGLAAYLGMNVFYLFDNSWLAPAILSPTDGRVLQISAQLAQYASEREKLVAQRQELLARADDMRRVAAAQKGFQRGFRSTVRADLAGLEQDLGRVRGLGNAAKTARADIAHARRAYSVLSRQRLDELLKARMIDREQFVGGSFQLSQIAQGDLSIARDEAAIEQQSATLHRQIQSLRALQARPDALGGGHGESMSYEALRMSQELERSLLEEARAVGGQEALSRAIAAVDHAIADYDRLIATARRSPLVKASEREMAVVNLPYENLVAAQKGAPLYGCYLGIVLCHKVGRIVEQLPGEVTFNHPLHNQVVRGRMVQIELDEVRWAEERVLFSRRLLF